MEVKEQLYRPDHSTYFALIYFPGAGPSDGVDLGM